MYYIVHGFELGVQGYMVSRVRVPDFESTRHIVSTSRLHILVYVTSKSKLYDIESISYSFD